MCRQDFPIALQVCVWTFSFSSQQNITSAFLSVICKNPFFEHSLETCVTAVLRNHPIHIWDKPDNCLSIEVEQTTQKVFKHWENLINLLQQKWTHFLFLPYLEWQERMRRGRMGRQNNNKHSRSTPRSRTAVITMTTWFKTVHLDASLWTGAS